MSPLARMVLAGVFAEVVLPMLKVTAGSLAIFLAALWMFPGDADYPPALFIVISGLYVGAWWSRQLDE